eukprot:TCALIF_13068-PA protein Name:"Similar to TY3B-I Transposon Ty3-I Gag-Pol polyprotein (Saccharomyces cerevisiae (strain ATCC 204508 / S288c))" AED:0.44 eAED:0.44 QI:0/0/0/0.75/1/1/4/0/326
MCPTCWCSCGAPKKDVAYQWLSCHQAEFEMLKKALTSDMVVRAFDPALPTKLLTDASRLFGIGFALVQFEPAGHIHLISCGSRSLTKCQQNYATIELECLTSGWAVEKSVYYLRGMQNFEKVTDQNPLLGFRERLVDYDFTLSWSAGKEHLIANALSQAEVFPSEDESDATVFALSVRVLGADRDIRSIVHAASSDPEYEALVQCFLSGGDPATNPSSRAYACVWPEGTCLVIPQSAQAGLLRLLHASHCGMVKTYPRARQLYYWPDMKNAISQLNLFVVCLLACLWRFCGTSVPARHYGMGGGKWSIPHAVIWELIHFEAFMVAI